MQMERQNNKTNRRFKSQLRFKLISQAKKLKKKFKVKRSREINKKIKVKKNQIIISANYHPKKLIKIPQLIKLHQEKAKRKRKPKINRALHLRHKRYNLPSSNSKKVKRYQAWFSKKAKTKRKEAKVKKEIKAKIVMNLAKEIYK